jgi:hypothetical protein
MAAFRDDFRDTSMLLGYARVSTDEQDLALQRRALREGGCRRLYEERLSGARRDRPEWGRLVKSLYMLSYIDDENYRRRILVQLNRGEGRHQLARVVFHGKRGELRQRYREGQEDQLGALGRGYA